MNYFFVFIGGGAGSIVRFYLSKLFPISGFNFPLATFLSNVFASLILGYVMGMFIHRNLTNENVKLLFTAGFCGGFSTFSTFSFDTFQLLSAGNFKLGLLNIFANILVCYLAVLAGVQLSKL